MESYADLLQPAPPATQPAADIAASTAVEYHEIPAAHKMPDAAPHHPQVEEPHGHFSAPVEDASDRANAACRGVEAKLKEQILLRHYSRKTLQAYAGWMRKFRGFVLNANPKELSGSEVKRFLADLAVRRRVSASAQNQAFNALLFLFRHVLKKDLDDLSDTPRAKRSRSIPTVLSRQEVEALFTELKEPYKLLAEPNLRNAPVTGQLRHTPDPTDAWAQRCANHDDLHPYYQVRYETAEEST